MTDWHIGIQHISTGKLLQYKEEYILLLQHIKTLSKFYWRENSCASFVRLTITDINSKACFIQQSGVTFVVVDLSSFFKTITGTLYKITSIEAWFESYKPWYDKDPLTIDVSKENDYVLLTWSFT